MGLLKPHVMSIRRLKNALPGDIALHTNERDPIKDCKSLKVIRAEFKAFSAFSMIFSNFCCGIETVKRTESISRPKNMIFVVGPTDLSGANGIPNFLQTASRTLTKMIARKAY